MEADSRQTGLLQIVKEVTVESHPVAQDEGLHSVVRNELHRLNNLGMEQRLAPGDGDVVAIPPPLEEKDLLFELVQALVAFEALPVAASAMEIAGIRDLEPADRVVIE